MPVLMVALMKELFADVLVGRGFAERTARSSPSPGWRSAFAAFSVGYPGFTFFRDHGWATWDRLRAVAGDLRRHHGGQGAADGLRLTTSSWACCSCSAGRCSACTSPDPVAALTVLIVVLALSLSAFGILVTARGADHEPAQRHRQRGRHGDGHDRWIVRPGRVHAGLGAGRGPAMPTYWAMRGLPDGDPRAAADWRTSCAGVVMAGFGGLFTALAARSSASRTARSTSG